MVSRLKSHKHRLEMVVVEDSHSAHRDGSRHLWYGLAYVEREKKGERRLRLQRVGGFPLLPTSC